MDSKNIFAAILAGGIGSRMRNSDKPKQFLKIGEKPIIIHTIEKFIVENEFEKIIVLTPKQWIKHTEDMINKYIIAKDKIVVIEGGTSRNATIINSINYIKDNYTLNDDTILVTHDSVRPFVTQRIIKDNIEITKKDGACDTVIAATDTIVESKNNKHISSIPDRSIMYQGQTPQSFKAKKLQDIYNTLSNEEKDILTDACKILLLKGEKVSLVDGEVFNIKITYPYDIKVAEAVLSKE